MCPPAVAIAGAAVAGGISTAVAGSKAAKAQKQGAKAAADASERATQLQVDEAKRQYDLTRSDYEPYRETGYKALDTLAGLYGVGGTKIDPTAALEATPGYKFQLDEGLKAINRSNAARGILNSGGADKARMRYASGLAASNYDAFANRIAALAGVGQSATGQTAAAGQAASNAITSAYGVNGQNQANAAMAAGNARASSYANIGASISGATNNLASLYLMNNGGWFNRPTGTAGGNI
ncbi:hypothetical protein [Sphingobium chungbukense]|uniref:DNA transfer protein n=1 Tax=Sphingobium chungbukense TaxID=56193 RepID=A0A0M3AS29_9SPHN|nr:hypothetical protein [Sphingobium chungbukense]KKW92688.1 hypothetical protein YP76_07080 [Sphingobium chungbukense]